MNNRGFRLVFTAILMSVTLWCRAELASAQAEESEPEETVTLEDASEDDYVRNHRFWGIELGAANPIGSSKRFNTPTNIIFNTAPEPYSDFFRAGLVANVYTGIMTEEGFEASIAFRLTKINYSNLGTAQILSDVQSVDPSATFSSYLLGTQVYLGQRLKPVYTRRESLYFGAALELSALKHFSDRLTVADDETFSLSFIAGDEIPIQRDPNSFQMMALRVQVEYVALAGNERPRFVTLSFGVRGYLR